jgi:hypothetical protein
LTGSTDKRPPLAILIRAGAFPDEHQSSRRVALAEYYIQTALMQRAPGAVAQVFSYILKGFDIAFFRRHQHLSHPNMPLILKVIAGQLSPRLILQYVTFSV